MPINSVLQIVNEIDRMPVLSLASVQSALGLELRDTHADSPVLRIYQGKNEHWANVELRLLRAEGKTGAMLTLAPAEPIPMDLLVNEFGKQPALSPPNPRAGDRATMAYEYQRPNGRLSLVFRDFQHYFVESIIFDRLP